MEPKKAHLMRVIEGGVWAVDVVSILRKDHARSLASIRWRSSICSQRVLTDIEGDTASNGVALSRAYTRIVRSQVGGDESQICSAAG